MTKHTQRRELDFERLKHTHPSTPTHRQFLWGFPISVKCFWISSNLKRVIILVDIADLIVQMSPTDTFYSSDHGFSNWWLLPDPGNTCLIFMISGNNCAIQLNMKFLSVKNKKVSYPFGPMYTAISNVLHMSVNACFFAQLPSTLSTTWRLERARVKITKTTWHWHITVTSVKSITFQRNAKLRQRLWSFCHSFGFILRCRVILK